ncbi:MAG: hypothetical protein F4X56_08930 [Gammaproteobacteria bacterium]|nr:hypothetical protein [Gammaproteobacteria bacterium]
MIDRTIATILVGILCCLGVQSHGNSTDKPLEIRAIYPQGEEVNPFQRITIEFNQRVVALGASMFAEDDVPIDIEPALDCEWNWVKLDTLTCELPGDTNLDGSTKYTVTVRPGIKAPNGRTLEAEYVHSFQTILPEITESKLVSWVSPTQPIIEVTFNQRVKLGSLRNRLFLHDSVSGEEISTIVRSSNWDVRYAMQRDYFGRAQSYQGPFFNRRNIQLNEYLQNSVLIIPESSLSPGAVVSVVLLPGVEGANGNLKSITDYRIDTEVTTFDEFRLLGLGCKDIAGTEIFLKTDETNQTACDVNSYFLLVLSSQFADREIEGLVHTQPPTEATGWRFISRGNRAPGYEGFVYSLSGDFKSSTTYRLYLSQNKESKDGDKKLTPVQDGFGRPLMGNNEITFRTGPPAPRAYINGSNVVVDSRGSLDAQILLGNIDDVTVQYQLLDEVGKQKNLAQQKQSPKQDDVLQAQFLGLRDMLRSPSGVVIGSIEGQPRFDHAKKPSEDFFFVQATPYSVFLKLGTVNTIAWVVDFQTGEPIADAKVEFYLGDPSDLGKVNESIHSAVTDQDGLVSLPGYEVFDPHWNRSVHEINRACLEDNDCSTYFLRVETDQGMSLLPLDSDFILQEDGPISSIYRNIDPWTTTSSIYRNIDHWTTTSQKLYSPGDTVEIKGYVRSVRNEVRIIPTTGHFALCIVGAYGREYEIAPISLNQFGAYDASLKLNNLTEFGEYEIKLLYDPIRPVDKPCSTKSNGPNVYAATGGSFQVFEFKTNPIRVTQELNDDEFERGDSMSITSNAELHAGGPYAHAKGQLDVWLTPMEIPFETVDPDQFAFNIRDENVHPFGREFWTEIESDDRGRHTHTIDSLNNDVYYGQYLITSALISDRGKSVAASTTVPYFGVDQFVGISRNRDNRQWYEYDRWIKVDEPWPIQVMVLSKDDEIVTGKEVQIKVFESLLDPNLLEQTSLYSSDIKWQEIFDCTVVSDQSAVSCDFTPPKKNFYRIEAQIVDTNGNAHNTSIRLRARVGTSSPTPMEQPKDVVNVELNCNSVDVAVGDVVQCTVKNQLSRSPALVTIERSGVIDSWLVRLDPKHPVIEFTVLEDYAPHFKLSVLSVSPTNATSGSRDALYRMGSKKFKMHNPRLELIPIKISLNSESYSPRDRVELSISANGQKGETVPIEYAVAVIDESLLDLGSAKDEYFDPTKKRWSLNASGLRTYGLINSLLQKSELLPLMPEPYWDQSSGPVITSVGSKIARTEGFGSDLNTDPNVRTIDRFVAYWNPSLISTNAQETITFDLPDNLTSWKVVVLAVSTNDQFGYATTTFGSIKETEIRAVAPNVVTEGDTFHVGASIFNRADRVRALTVELQASGLLNEESTNGMRQELEFKPFERKVVTWEVQAGIRPTNFQEISRNSEIRVVASASDSQDKDALDIRIPVRPRHVRVSSVAYGALAGDKTRIPIEVSAKLATEDGQLDLTLTTNDEVNLEGVFRYALEYPYTCWEQQLSQAIIAMQYVHLKERGAKHRMEWPDPQSAITHVLDSAIEFQAPNGGMVYFVPTNRNSDVYLSAYTAIAFSWLEKAGYDVPKQVRRKLLDYLREHLDEQKEKSEISNITATVSAVILNSLALAGELKESDLEHLSEYVNQMKLFGLAHYLQASISLNSKPSLNQKIFDRIMNHRFLVDGVVEFKESTTLTYTRMLHSDTRSLCTVLNALTKFSSTTSNGIDVGELKELSNSVRYARENSPHWLNTQDNVFCTHALIEFADFVESDAQDWIATVDLQSSDTGSSIELANAWEFNSNNTRFNTVHPMKAQNFGLKGALEINRSGGGHAFYSVELAYLTTVDETINRFSGFEINREYFALRGNNKWQLLKPGDEVEKGDYVLVNLFLNNRFNRYHVVVDDSVPGGLEPVNQSLGTEYRPHFDENELVQILAQSQWYGDFRDGKTRWSHLQKFHSELGLQNVRFYSSILRRGKHHLTWFGQVISAGEFTVLPTHVEEMYRPMMFGKSEPWTFKVKTKSL